MAGKATNSRQRIIDYGEVFPPRSQSAICSTLSHTRANGSKHDSWSLLAGMVTGLNTGGFERLVSLGVFNSGLMNHAVWKFRRYDDASLRYMGITRHGALKLGLWDTALSEEDFQTTFEGLTNE
jgi:hypothetical protein